MLIPQSPKETHNLSKPLFQESSKHSQFSTHFSLPVNFFSYFTIQLELAKEHNQEELAKIYRKEKNNHTWSWNAHYHRDCIRRAEKDLIYHKAKLEVAKVKTKEEKRKKESK